MDEPGPFPRSDGRDPDAELRHLQRRFRNVRLSYERRRRRPALLRWMILTACAAALSFAVFLGLFILSPWSPGETLRHVLAFPNCDATRAVGLAPAHSGDPGYWARNDRDGDGVSCEPVPA